ncbi:MAG: InlB B-repeat-containing protein [Clostridia bacterium]|nr:InlB B-repeat-containing protein [Clostridia bacterium]
MKKRLFIIFALLLVIPTLLICMLTGCAGDGDGDGAETTAATTLAKGEFIGSELVRNKDMGFFAYGEVVSDNEAVADAAVRSQNDGILIKYYSDGTATFTVNDYWGNVATVSITVENSEVSNIDVTPFEDANSVNVRFMGAYGNGLRNDTEAIQSAIDSLPNGGTVYIPAGTYDIDKIVLHENITLMLQGEVNNVAAGYTNTLAARVDAGEFAILKDGSFVNHEPNGPGNLGESNIAIIGGMIDFNGAAATKTQIDVNHEGPAAHPGAEATGCIAISCGSNFRFENIIFKDVYNAHAFQICGVKDVVIKDCMFAGYMGRAETKGVAGKIVTNRETIQIEYAHSGAIPPATFAEGEFYYCENVVIEGCYFGDSDKSGYHVTAIGQHGQNGTANVTGLKVTDCVFDNPYYSAMRFPNYVDVEITKNRFMSSEKGYYNGGYFLWLYTENSNKTYAGKTQSGTSQTIVSAHAYEHDGIHNVDIKSNIFAISGSSNMRVLSAESTGLSQGARTISNVMRQVDGQLYGASYTGFVECTNLISDLDFSNNTIAIYADNYTYKTIIYCKAVYGLKIENNKVDTGSGVNLTNSGVNIATPISDTVSNQFEFISSLPNKSVIIDNGKGGTITLKSDSSSRKLILQQTEHCKITYTVQNGNVIVKVVCDEGYTFSGWTKSGTAYNPSSSVTMTGNITLVATCTK